MRPDAVLEKLALVEPDHGFSVGSVKVSRTDHATAAEVDTLLDTDWRGATGWIARQSAVAIVPGQPDNPTEGAVIEAEVTLGARTLQLRRLPGTWVATEITEGQGDPRLCDEVVVVTVEGKAARYRRYWSVPADGAVAVVACRLIAFEEIA